MCVHADDVQCYFSFHRDSFVDMIHNKIRALKCLHGYAPSYLKNLINSRSVSARYTLRVNDDNLLLQTITSLNFARSQSMFLCASPKIWNSLPLSLRKIETSYLFKKRLEAYYLNLTFEDITTVLMQARSQKFAMGGCFGVWGRSHQRLKVLHFFAKITSF